MQEEPTSEYAMLTEIELVQQAKATRAEAFDVLIGRYVSVAKKLVQHYQVFGLEQEDLVQEALVGFLKALRSFEEDRGVPFASYAVLCMKRQVHTALKSWLGRKHRPLNNYVPLEDSQLSTDVSVLTDACAVSPESLMIQSEETQSRNRHIRSLLSAFEQVALNLYLSGYSYEEMAERLNSTPKSVDNALQRVRRKLRSVSL